MTSSAALGARQESESEYDLRCAGMNCELPDLLWGRSATPSPAEVGESVGVGEAEDACAAPVLGVEEPHQSIPNLVVKPYCGDNTVGEALRENSSTPG